MPRYYYNNIGKYDIAPAARATATARHPRRLSAGRAFRTMTSPSRVLILDTRQGTAVDPDLWPRVVYNVLHNAVIGQNQPRSKTYIIQNQNTQNVI